MVVEVAKFSRHRLAMAVLTGHGGRFQRKVGVQLHEDASLRFNVILLNNQQHFYHLKR